MKLDLWKPFLPPIINFCISAFAACTIFIAANQIEKLEQELATCRGQPVKSEQAEPRKRLLITQLTPTEQHPDVVYWGDIHLKSDVVAKRVQPAPDDALKITFVYECDAIGSCGLQFEDNDTPAQDAPPELECPAEETPGFKGEHKSQPEPTATVKYRL